jgi:hypothetical protein
MTPTTPSPISPVKEFEALCDLIPEDAYWGMPLTPDLVRHIRDCSTAPTTGSPLITMLPDESLAEYQHRMLNLHIHISPVSPAAVPIEVVAKLCADHLGCPLNPNVSAFAKALLAASMGGDKP